MTDDRRKGRDPLRPGYILGGAKKTTMAEAGIPFARDWKTADADWGLPNDWQKIFLQAFRRELRQNRALKIFMDTCVRCGACADKCHYYLGGGDPKNSPVARAELLRSVYRQYFTASGRLFGPLAGGRRLTVDSLKELTAYFYQCSECRRCSVYCSFGIDTAEITMAVREILLEIGIGFDWILEAVNRCDRFGNHIGAPPDAVAENIEFLADETEAIIGRKINWSLGRTGAEILFVTSSADFYAEPQIFTGMGYLALFEYLGLDVTISAYAGDGGNFGLFSSRRLMKKLNGKIYEEARRLGVKWILGGECGHMWRVFSQASAALNDPGKYLEAPISPITGTRFGHAAASGAIHIVEFLADLIDHGSLQLDRSRNDGYRTTFHDSCNPARVLGMFDEPRKIINAAMNNFWEMDSETIREKTLCCGSGGGLHAEALEQLRFEGGKPRADEVGKLKQRQAINMLLTICSIDKAVFGPLLDHWVGGVEVGGLAEMLANALVFEPGELRKTDMRGRAINSGG